MDVKEEQVVTDSGVIEPPAPADSVSQDVATDTSVQTDAPVVQEAEEVPAAQGEKGPIPYTRFQEVNEQKKAAEARAAQLEQYVQGLQANAQKPPQESLTLTVMRELGYDPDDILTGADQAKITDAVLNRMQAMNASQSTVNNFISSRPDYAKVVGYADPITGQFVTAPPLQRALQNNPSLALALKSAGANATILAYELACKDPQYQKELAEASKPPVVKESETAAKAIQQANSLTSISAVSSSGVLDKAASLRAMSNEEFEAYKQKIMSGG